MEAKDMDFERFKFERKPLNQKIFRTCFWVHSCERQIPSRAHIIKVYGSVDKITVASAKDIKNKCVSLPPP
jgi:hypothetical protein